MSLRRNHPRHAPALIPHMHPLDLVHESISGLFSRPGRTALTVLGTVVGLAALVATLGLSRTAGNRIVGRFDELAATEIIVSSRPAPRDGVSHAIPWDAEQRLRRLNGVVAAGTLSVVDVGQRLISSSPVSDPVQRTDFRFAVVAASPGLFDAVRAEVSHGRVFDGGFSEREDSVAIIGANAAARLGIADLSRLPAIRIGDDVFLVAGVLERVARQHDLLGAVVIPEGTARAKYGHRAPDLVVVETSVGAADLITEQIPLALRPDKLDALKVVSPPDQRRFRDAVAGDLNILFLVLGGVSLLVGAIGIANVTLVSVMERIGEIGLRRALGATKRQIAAQFLLESTAMGLVGGILGTSLGVLVVVGVAAYQQWTPVLDAPIPLLSPVAGALVGLVAGLYPALRGAGLEPVDALRSGT